VSQQFETKPVTAGSVVFTTVVTVCDRVDEASNAITFHPTIAKALLRAETAHANE
jgi:hypothetical protein